MNHAIIYEEPDLSNAIKGDFVMRDTCPIPREAINVRIEEGRLWYEVDPLRGIFSEPLPYSLGDTVTGLEEWVWFSSDKNDIMFYDDIKPKPNTMIARKVTIPEPASTMPEEFSRLHHEVTDIKVQKLGDMHISDPDIYNWVITMKEAE